MKKSIHIFFALFLSGSTAFAQLTVLHSFDPSNAAGLCGLGHGPPAPVGTVYVYGCFESTIQSYTDSGVYLTSYPVAGETANDVDVFTSWEDVLVGSTTVPAGTLLFSNGETDEAEIYAIDSSGNVIDTLHTSFGLSHVVGGAYHWLRNTFFLLQDNVPGASDQNMVAEIDPMTGDTIQTFQTTGEFDISYGDIDVSQVSGLLYIVSSNEDSIAEYTPTGTLVQKYGLPAGVNNLSGIAVDCAFSTFWVSTTAGMVYHLGGFPCITPGVGENPVIIHQSFYPNPFSGSATLEMKLAENIAVNIEIVDLSGRVLERIFEGELHAGLNKADVKPDGIVPGIYILRISAGSATYMHKFIYMRE